MESRIFSAIGIDPGLIIIVLCLLFLLTLFSSIKQSIQLKRLEKKYKTFMGGKDAVSLEREFYKRFEALDAIAGRTEKQAEIIRSIKESQSLAKNKIGILKYDAFSDVGGKLSFAIAMLDEKNDGFILNAIHNSNGCYTYLKEIIKGESYVILGEEEKVALEMAIGSNGVMEIQESE